MTDEQKKKLAELEEAIRIRMCDPWHERLHDLILYKIMNLSGISIRDIDSLIRTELRKLKGPEGKG